MKLGIVIYSKNSETVWNGFRFGNFAIEKKGDSVSIFLIADGVEANLISSEQFNVLEMMNKFVQLGGTLYACGTCLKSRNSKGYELYKIATLEELYSIINESDKVISF